MLKKNSIKGQIEEDQEIKYIIDIDWRIGEHELIIGSKFKMMRIFCFWWNIFLRNPIDCKISVMKLFNLIVKCQMLVMTL